MPVLSEPLVLLLIAASVPPAVALGAAWLVRHRRAHLGAWILWIAATWFWVTLLLPSINGESPSHAATARALKWGLVCGPAIGLAQMLRASLGKRPPVPARRGFEVLRK